MRGGGRVVHKRLLVTKHIVSGITPGFRERSFLGSLISAIMLASSRVAAALFCVFAPGASLRVQPNLRSFPKAPTFAAPTLPPNVANALLLAPAVLAPVRAHSTLGACHAAPSTDAPALPADLAAARVRG